MGRQAVVVVLATVLLGGLPFSAGSGGDEVAFGIHVDDTRVPLGRAVLIRVTATDASGDPVPGVPLTLSAEDVTVVTSAGGVALFRVSRDAPETVAFAVQRADTSRLVGSFTVEWSQIGWDFGKPLRTASPGEAVTVTGTARWKSDGAPVRNLQMYVTLNDVTYLSQPTGRDGQTEVRLRFPDPDVRRFEVFGDVNATRHAFEVAWQQARDDRNRPPVLESFSLEFQGRSAIAVPGRAYDPDGDAVTIRYEWRVNGSRLQESRAQIAVPPSSAVEVTAYASDGVVASDFFTARGVAPANAAPTAVVASETSADGAVLFVDASASSDPESEPLEFQWLVGDILRASGRLASLPLPIGGGNVTLRVLDPWGASDTVLVVLPARIAQEPRSTGNEPHVNDSDEAPPSAADDGNASRDGSTRGSSGAGTPNEPLVRENADPGELVPTDAPSDELEETSNPPVEESGPGTVGAPTAQRGVPNVAPGFIVFAVASLALFWRRCCLRP